MFIRKQIRLALVVLTLACLTLGGIGPGLSSSSASAQTTTGRLIITVKDPDGAIVSGATISILNQDTHQEVAGASNESGIFTQPQMQVGLYTVTVTAPNFKQSIQTDVKIDVGQDRGLVVALELGVQSESVTVTAGDDLVQTSNATVTTTVNQKQVQDLPLDGRDPLQLIKLQAGVSGDNGLTTHINGQRTTSTDITQDGINVQDNFIRTNATDFIPNRTSVSQVAEFSVTTSNASPDAAGSASIRFVTPSGGNDLHGSLFEYHRNDALGANEFFNNAASPTVEKPQLIRNQFGFLVSGPVYIPKVFNGRDKFFFFASYEGFRERKGANTIATILSPEARLGNFSYVTSNGVRTVNVLDVAGISADPTIGTLLGLVPTTINSTDVGDGLNTGGFAFNKSVPVNRNQGGTRLDYQLGDKHHFEAIYNYTAERMDRSDIDTTFHQQLLGGLVSTTRFGVAAWNYTITPSLVNEVRAGFNNSRPEFFADDPNTLGVFLGLPLITNPLVQFENQGRRALVKTILDTASYTAGPHFFRFGYQFDQIRVRQFNAAGRTPSFGLGFSPVSEGALTQADLPGAAATDLARANALLALLGGVVASGSRTFQVTSATSGFVPGVSQVNDFAYDQHSPYVSDQWRIRPTITLIAGLRWNYVTPIQEENNLALLPRADGRTSGRDIVLDPNGITDFANGNFYEPDKNNFAPNVGVAWDVFGDGKTVVRAGYSQAYINDEQVTATLNAVRGNAGLTQTVTNSRLFGTVSNDVPQLLATTFATPEFMVPISFAEQRAISPASAAFTISPTLQTPKYHQWNVTVEREVGWDTAVSARYVGNVGRDLIRAIDYNQINIYDHDFLADFLRARSNGFLSEALNGVFNPAYNPNIPGSQQLTVFPLLAGGGLLTNTGTIRPLIRSGEAGQLAGIYVGNGLEGSVNFRENPSVFAGDVVENASSSSYNALQLEVRRRFSSGLQFQANYTWSKVLTDASVVGNNGDDQSRFTPYLDINNRSLERSRADYDIPHVFKANVIYDLPFGNGQRFDPDNKIAEAFAGGWETTSIITWQTGAPFGIYSNRGTFNRGGSRAISKNTANSSLTYDEIKDHIGYYRTPEGLFFIDPALINQDSGTAVADDGAAPFSGQVFFNPGPGEVGSLERLAFNGPQVFNWDLSFIKRTNLTEQTNLELRFEFFNVLNHPIFGFFDQDINSNTFGRIQGTINSARVVQIAAKINF